MTRFIAELGLVVGGLAVMLGNYWFTFGLWPKSWASFVWFGVAAIVLMTLRTAIQKDNK